MDQRRTMLAVLLSLGVVLLYNELVVRPRQHDPSLPPASVPVRPETSPIVAPPPDQAQEPPHPATPAVQDISYLSFDASDDRPVIVETDLWRATITKRGGRLRSEERRVGKECRL